MPDCPNHGTALATLQDALSFLGLRGDIELIPIGSDEEAVRHRFLGSPSIRINGRDLNPERAERENYSLACRRYRWADETTGAPPKQMIVEALIRAFGTEGAR